MTKDEQKIAKAYLKKMQKALKKAPISLQEQSQHNLEQIDWNEERRLQTAKEQLFSRLSKEERYESLVWVRHFEYLAGGDE